MRDCPKCGAPDEWTPEGYPHPTDACVERLRAQVEQEQRRTVEAQRVAREIATESGFDGTTKWEWWTDQYPWLNRTDRRIGGRDA